MALFLSALLLYSVVSALIDDAPIKLNTSTGVDMELLDMFELPRTVQVQKYTLDFEPFPLFSSYDHRDFTFRAQVEIQFRIIKSTSTLWLNSERLTISNLTLFLLNSQNDQTPVEIANQNLVQENFIVLKAKFETGQNYLLHIDYSGPLTKSKDKGVFYSTYKTLNGTSKPFVSTWSQPTYSRRLFPNFDDPSFKSTFKVKVRAPKKANVYSNQEIETLTELNPRQNLAIFKITPRMPSYSLSVLVGDLRHRKVQSKNGVLIRAISIPEVEPYLKEPAQILSKCFDATQSLFDLKYPIKKLDMFIHPSYHGAVEDVGLIKIEDDVLQLPNSMPATEQFYATNLICHEAAHTFFGNIVTADKWTDVWLHESFASFLSFRTMVLFVDDARYLESEYLRVKQVGIKAMLKSPLPIAQTNANFGDIVYDAGASVLRMLEAIIGADKFQKILNLFVKKFAYRNVRYSDFVDVVEKEFTPTNLCGTLTIREVMNDYLTQSNVPTISIGFDKIGRPKLAQKESNWNVPLFLENKHILWLLKNGSLCSSTPFDMDKEELPILNYKSYSFGVFQYSLSYWNRLLRADLTKIDEITLLGLIQDLKQQIRTKRSRKLKPALQLLIVQIFHQFKGRVLPHFIEDLQYLDVSTQRSLVNLAYPHAKWLNSSSWSEGHFSAEVLQLAVEFDIGDARSRAKSLFYEFAQDCKSFEHLETCNRIDANARKAVYSIAALIKHHKFLNAYKIALEERTEPYFYFKQELRNIEDSLF